MEFFIVFLFVVLLIRRGVVGTAVTAYIRYVKHVLDTAVVMALHCLKELSCRIFQIIIAWQRFELSYLE
jgi:hypothetical protein